MPTSLINGTTKKSLRIVWRKPASTLDHQFKFTPSTTPPTPLVALERAVLEKNYVKAVVAFQDVPPSDLNRFAYDWVMQAHMALGNYTEVVRLFEEAESTVPLLHSRIRYHYILALNRQSRFADAIDAFIDWYASDWNTAKTIMDAMTTKAHITPDGPSYFYLISTAVKCRHACPPLTALSIAESATDAGFPISVSLLSHILLDAAGQPTSPPSQSSTSPPSISPSPRRVAAIRRALDLWDAHHHYDAFTPACEKAYELALLRVWHAGLQSEAVQVVEDIVALPTPSRSFKFRLANMLLTQAAPVNADMSMKLLDLMHIHKLGKLSGKGRYRLFAGWTKMLDIEDIAALFSEYQDVTHGWNGSRLSDLFIFGYRHFHDKGGRTAMEFQRVMELFTFAFRSGETLSYPALEHAVRWLYEMGKAKEALQIIQTIQTNPDLPIGTCKHSLSVATGLDPTFHDVPWQVID
ncbi:hypothetical protein DYB32_001685 [Aphanomyces invadans]|uniref:Uncharacterized protein n=1 Tax=Aphanomyces invadans TaxID=157072 RepID=A0A3R6ZUY3_9STRA|nr:hypothetical protein DYB32_001685 [Aphanomyces invadans]